METDHRNGPLSAGVWYSIGSAIGVSQNVWLELTIAPPIDQPHTRCVVSASTRVLNSAGRHQSPQKGTPLSTIFVWSYMLLSA